MKIYLLGYQNIRSLDELVALCQRLSAKVLDIRYNPRSRIPHWNKGPMTRRYDLPYAHLPELGNVNYKSPDAQIEIANFRAGQQAIAHEDTDVILMCACKDAHTCHRTVVGNLLREEGYEVIELNP